MRDAPFWSRRPIIPPDRNWRSRPRKPQPGPPQHFAACSKKPTSAAVLVHPAPAVRVALKCRVASSWFLADRPEAVTALTAIFFHEIQLLLSEAAAPGSAPVARGSHPPPTHQPVIGPQSLAKAPLTVPSHSAGSSSWAISRQPEAAVSPLHDRRLEGRRRCVLEESCVCQFSPKT